MDPFPGHSSKTSPSAARSRRAAHAFTLIELMVVLALIGILSAMVLPEMRGSLEEVQLRANARKLIAACDVAYSRAVATGKTLRLEWDRSNGKYRIVNEADGPTAGQALDFPGASGTVDSRITVDLRRLTQSGGGGFARGGPATPGSGAEPAAMPGAPETGIEFRPDGTADASEFILQDRAGFRLSLRINPVTARIRLRELPRS